MSCCEDCKKDVSNRVEFDVDVHFDISTTITERDIIGEDVDFVSGILLTADGAMPKGGFQIQFHSYGDRKHINIYRNRLPFDELMATIQFNSSTGGLKVEKFSLVEFAKVRLTFTKKHIEKKPYLELGDGVYRVPDYLAGIHLSNDLDIWDSTLVAVQRGFRENTEWPVLLLHHDQALCVLFNPTHDTWKNDALWQ